MYIRVFKDDVIQGVIKASNVVSLKAGAAYLRTLWIKAEDGRLIIMSTDSNIEFTGKYPANVLEPGLVGVEGKKFSDLIRKLKPGEIVFKGDAEKNTFFIEQEKRRYKLQSTERSWFPELSSFPENENLLWSGELLREIIDKISFVISDDPSLGAMTSMKIGKGNEDQHEVEICGVDIENMGLYRVRNQDVFDILPEKGLLIPKKYLLELRKWLKEEEIELSISSDRLFFRSADHTEVISFPLSYEEFTNYRDILDSFESEQMTVLEVNRKDLMDALERVLIFCTELNKSAIFELSENDLKIDSTAVESGEANEVLECRYNGNVDEIVFNIKGMLDILAHFESEEISFNLSDNDKPCMITGKEDPDYLVVTMPVEIKEETYYTEEGDY